MLGKLEDMKKILVFLLFPYWGISQSKVSPDKAFEHYLNNGDTHFSYELKDTGRVGTAKTYQFLLTSQQWKGITWRHQLTIVVPSKLEKDGSLLIISGGGNTAEQPNWSTRDGLWPVAAQMAETNRALVAVLKQTPNQPLFGGLKEDALICYTLDQFRKDGDTDWPLLFPMTKSAIRAMDAVQDFSTKKLHHEVNNFFVAGASKRGWTTWLTAASGDKRVKAIGPMVIDMLNMPKSLQYQFDSYGAYSEQIIDYVRIEIPQSTSSPKGKAITTMIDPYSYRKKLNLPKIIFIGTNDEYWTVDAIKWYINEIPGETMIHYVPNAGHDLGGGVLALQTLGTLYGKMLNGKPYPVLKNHASAKDGKAILDVTAPTEELEEVVLWTATCENRDFRKQKWASVSLGKGKAENHIEVELPKSGYKAFYVDFKFKGTEGPCTVSTRMYLLSEKGIE